MARGTTGEHGTVGTRTGQLAISLEKLTLGAVPTHKTHSWLTADLRGTAEQQRFPQKTEERPDRGLVKNLEGDPQRKDSEVGRASVHSAATRGPRPRPTGGDTAACVADKIDIQSTETTPANTLHKNTRLEEEKIQVLKKQENISTYLVIRKMEINATMKYHYVLTRLERTSKPDNDREQAGLT